MSTSTSTGFTAAYSSDSAGMHPSHTLPVKLRAIASAGFGQVELAFPDLEEFATQRHRGYQKLDSAGQGDLEGLLEAAKEVKSLCSSLGLEIAVVHPFSQFEGYTDTVKRAQSFSRAKAWFVVLNALGCTMLQVGSSNDPSSSGDFNVIVQDLSELADLAASQKPPIKIAYEMWAWGVHVNTWEHTWAVCKRVNKDNFGLCLDTFQICARAYVNPTCPPLTLPNADNTLHESLANLTRTVPPEKIFYFQISDGSCAVPASTLHTQSDQEKEQGDPGAHPLYSWSNAWRPLPWMNELPSVVRAREKGALKAEMKEFGGYLPVMEVVRAVARTGWKGLLSYEVFYEKSMSQPGEDVSELWTNAGMECHERILRELGEVL